MNANLNKLISSATIVLAMTSSAFAQNQNMQNNKACPCPPFEQGTGLTNCENFPPAYNAPARTDVKCSWDIFVSGAFTYWFVDQGGMSYGQNTTTLAGVVLPPGSSAILRPNGTFEPGFKVALGANFCHDAWVGLLEYTWFRATLDQSSTAPTDARGGTASIALNNWFAGTTTTTAPATASSISTTWNVRLDMLDATLSRPYYEGRKLTMTPSFGLRAAWIRQDYDLTATIIATTGAPTSPVTSTNSSSGWALGPCASAQGHWLLGCGFRIEGDVGGSVLFTRYTKVRHSEGATSTTTTNPGFYTSSVHYRNYNCLRPMTNLGLGLGWGSYLDCQNYHIDIAANYDFMFMWGQNMLRQLVDDSHQGVNGSSDSLDLNGLTLTMRFDF